MHLAGAERSLAWEEGCVARTLRGDRRAFGELYAAFARKLYWQVLLPRLGSAPAAEEALAETFRAALEGLAGWEPRGQTLFAWLCAIAARKAADQHREQARTGKALASFEGLVGPLREDGEAQAERRLDQQRLRALAEAVLEAIHPRYRRAIELRFFEERERAACAEALGTSLGTFDVVLLRALRAFRATWVERHGSGDLP